MPEPDLATLAAGISEPWSGMVLSDRSEVTRWPAPFLRGGGIWKVEYMTHHYLAFYVGWMPGSPSTRLDNPVRFVTFARAAGLLLDTEPRRVAYVKAFLGLTEDELQGLVEAPAEIPFVVPRTAAEVEARAAADPEYRDVMLPIALEEVKRRRELEATIVPKIARLRLPGAAPWRGVVHGIARGRRIVRFEITLPADGWVQARMQVVAEDVPVTQVSP